jgi:iron complex transport system substrate-binding protein
MNRLAFPSSVLLLFALALGAHVRLAALSAPSPVPTDPQRIVSLAPSVTETLFALGLGPKVAGVTQYCNYPAEALEKPRVAGFSDVNYEAVLKLKPDLIVVPQDKTATRQNLEHLGLAVLPAETRTISGLMDDIRVLGRSTGHENEARALLDAITAGVNRARARAAGQTRPRVLFSVMHSYEGLGYITEINVVGNDGFFNDMLEIAGGRNVYTGRLAFPRLSREALIYLNPEVIIDVIPATENIDGVRRDWQSLSSVQAVKDNRIVFLTDESATVPGPRFPDTLELLSRAFHPPKEP